MTMDFTLVEVKNRHPVTVEKDSSFYLCIQRAALLALKEAGELTQMQYRQTEEALLRQCNAHD